MQAEVEVTESITTSDHQIIFLTSHKHSDEYFCSVGSYSQQSFDLLEIGQQQVFENIIEIDESWDLENMDVVVLIQSMQNNRILQASSSNIVLDNLLMLNTNLISIENDNDSDGNLNPGENATLNFSLEKSSFETLVINSLALGPETTKTPLLLVRFSNCTEPSVGIHFKIQS